MVRLRHIPTLGGVTAFIAICDMMSEITLSGMQLFAAITALIIIYAVTTFWYIWTIE